MAMHVLQRPDWDGEPVRLSIVWILKKGPRTIQCLLYSHQFGWELRMAYAQTLVRSEVCRSEDAVLTTQEQWRVAMLAKGWQSAEADSRRPASHPASARDVV